MRHVGGHRVPGLADLQGEGVLVHRQEGLTEAEQGGAGHAGHAGVEVGLQLGADLPTLDLVARHVKSQTGRDGGKGEGVLRVQVLPVDHVAVFRQVIEKVFRAVHALTGIGDGVVADESVPLELGVLRAGVQGRGQQGDGQDEFLAHINKSKTGGPGRGTTREKSWN